MNLRDSWNYSSFFPKDWLDRINRQYNDQGFVIHQHTRAGITTSGRHKNRAKKRKMKRHYKRR